MTAVQLPLLPVGPPAAPTLLNQRRRGTDFLRLPVRAALNSPATTGMGFWSLNPYVGCEFGCSYCYARDTHRYLVERLEGPSASEPAGPVPDFERRIFIKTEVADVVRRTLNPARLGNATLVIGTATDPYQPAERQFGLTRRVLEALTGFRGLTLAIITKSALVVRDIDVLLRLADRHDVRIHLSLASMDAVLLRRFEPRTPLPHTRIRALAALTRAGLHAGVLLAPILPGITDGWASLAAVFEAAKGAGARYVTGSALRLGPAARTRFLPLLRREFPDLASRYENHFAGRYNASRPYQRALDRRLALLREAFGFPADGAAAGR
jgi:DNA repair photolyase